MRIIVVGAGYAGTMAANRLAKKVTDAEIMVINPSTDFVERVRLHQQIAGSACAGMPLKEMLREDIELRVATVDRIADGKVVLVDGEQIKYDYAVLATGGTVLPLPGTIPVGTGEGAERARIKLEKLAGGSTVTVIGGGLTGIETAAEIAETRKDIRVQLVAESLGAGFTPRSEQRVRANLTRLHVEAISDSVVTVVNSDDNDIVKLKSGAELNSNLTLWAIATDIPDLSKRSGLQVNSKGQAMVDEFLRSIDDPSIFVVGDCAAVPGARLSCQSANPQGAHAADTIARIVKEKRPKPYSMGYTGILVSLGRRNGLVQMHGRDGTVHGFFISGRFAAIMKELITRGAKYGSRTANYAWLPGKKIKSSIK